MSESPDISSIYYLMKRNFHFSRILSKGIWEDRIIKLSEKWQNKMIDIMLILKEIVLIFAQLTFWLTSYILSCNIIICLNIFTF